MRSPRETAKAPIAFLKGLFQRSRPGEASAGSSQSGTRQAAAYLLNDNSLSARDRILVFADGPGATQIISFELPLAELRRSGDVALTMVSEGEFAAMGPRASERVIGALFDAHRPTVVVASRFAGMGAHAIAGECRKRGVRLVAHLDDNLFAVPPELGEAKYRKYNDRARLSRLRLLCERAQLVYASTETLAAQLRQLGIAAPVVSGAIYCAAPAPLAQIRTTADSLVFGYMGTSGHAADLALVEGAIAAILRAIPAARFETFGTIKAPAGLKSAFPERVREIEAAGSYLEFIEKFRAMGWRCGLAPLADTPFNACKADTKFVEYAVAGIPVVASDVNVYSRASALGGVRLARSEGEWIEAIRTLMNDERSARNAAAAAHAAVSRHYAMPLLTAQLCAVLELASASTGGENRVEIQAG